MSSDTPSGGPVARIGGPAAMGGLRTAANRWLRPYFALAVATFLVGAGAGAVAMAVSSPTALRTLADSVGPSQMFPERLTTWTIFSNNVVALGVLAVGAVTFGATTLFGLLFNGLLLGIVVYLGAANGELVRTVALIVPHGVFELAALFSVSAVAYRITWRVVQYLRGRAERPLTRQELKEAVALTVAALGLLAVAAWIEATLTVPIARVLVG